MRRRADELAARNERRQSRHTRSAKDQSRTHDFDQVLCHSGNKGVGQAAGSHEERQRLGSSLGRGQVGGDGATYGEHHDRRRTLGRTSNDSQTARRMNAQEKEGPDCHRRSAEGQTDPRPQSSGERTDEPGGQYRSKRKGGHGHPELRGAGPQARDHVFGQNEERPETHAEDHLNQQQAAERPVGQQRRT